MLREETFAERLSKDAFFRIELVKHSVVHDSRYIDYLTEELYGKFFQYPRFS